MISGSRTDLVGLKRLFECESICFTKTSMAEIRFHIGSQDEAPEVPRQAICRDAVRSLYDLSNRLWSFK